MRTWAKPFAPAACRIGMRGIKSLPRFISPTRLMRSIVPHRAAVPAADLLVAAIVATLLWLLGTSLGGPAVGGWSAIVFLLLSNPAFARLGGVSVRAQCETFIAAITTAAFLCLARSRFDPSEPGCVRRGVLLGLAFAFKYNAVAYVPAGLFALFALGAA